MINNTIPNIPGVEFMVSQYIPKDCTEEERKKGRQELIDMLYQMETQPEEFKFRLDAAFTKGTNTLLPVGTSSIPETKKEFELLKAFGVALKDGDNTKIDIALEEAKKEIHKNWIVNPMKYCPYWNELNGYSGGMGIDQTNPVNEFPQLFFHNDVLKLFVTGGTIDDFLKIEMRSTLFNCFAIFYINAALGIKKLVEEGKLNIEISLGSILDYADSIISYTNNRKEKNLSQ